MLTSPKITGSFQTLVNTVRLSIRAAWKVRAKGVSPGIAAQQNSVKAAGDDCSDSSLVTCVSHMRNPDIYDARPHSASVPAHQNMDAKCKRLQVLSVKHTS